MASLGKPRLKLNGVVGFSGGTGWHIMVVCVSVRKRVRKRERELMICFINLIEQKIRCLVSQIFER